MLFSQLTDDIATDVQPHIPAMIGDMQPNPSDPFVQAIRPLFRRRTVYRLLLSLGMVMAIFGYKSLFIIFGILITILALSQLIRVGLAIERNVWKRFSDQLDSIMPVLGIGSPEPLGGVIGSMGDTRTVFEHVAGTYGTYGVRLVTQTVEYKPESENGRYSRSYRVLELTTRQDFYHVFIDSKGNHQSLFSSAMNILSRSVRGNPRLRVEGDVHKFFDIYVPKGDDYKSLVTLTPEKLLALRDYGTKFDVEFVDNKIYLISRNKIKNVQDVLAYQKSALSVLANIGVDIQRRRQDTDGKLTVKTPTVFTF